MKPLVYWCRWNGAKLRLMGRDETAVWGELVLAEGAKPFRFELSTRILTIQQEQETRQLQLDEMGVVTESLEG